MSKIHKIILLIALVPSLIGLSLVGYATGELRILAGKIVGWKFTDDVSSDKMFVIATIGMIFSFVSFITFIAIFVMNSKGMKRSEKKAWIKKNFPWYSLLGYIFPIVAPFILFTLLPGKDRDPRSEMWAYILIFAEVFAGITILTTGVFLIKNLNGSIIS